MYKKYWKGVLDKSLAFMLLLILGPLIAIIGLLIYISIGKPIVFRQERPGKNEVLFSIYKFRTMTNQTNADGQLLSDEIRLTPLGRWFRMLSLDELPQLFNVLKGEMSFVGPRPLLPEYLKLYTSEQRRRHEVLPGVTGWAQVNGRNAITWEEKFKYDVWYVDHQSFLLDLKILWMTFLKVIQRSGVNSNASVGMKKFEGTK